MVQGWGSIGKHGSRNAVADPLRPDDQGRIVRHARTAAARSRDHEPQRHRKSGHAEALRPGNPGRERAHEMKFGVNAFIWTGKLRTRETPAAA